MPKTRRGSRKNRKTVRRHGGTKSAVSARKLRELTENPPSITSGVIPTIVPAAIKAAQKAIIYANANKDNADARKDAENKIAIADYWTQRVDRRTNWRNERRQGNSPNSRAMRASLRQQWYATSPNEHYVLE